MGITVDNSIRLLEDYRKWKKQFGIDGSGVDDATNKLLEVAKKYQKITEIIEHYRENVRDKVTNENMEKILEVVEDGNDK